MGMAVDDDEPSGPTHVCKSRVNGNAASGHPTTCAEKVFNAQRNGPRARIHMTSGGNYTGNWKDDRRHGMGNMVFKNGDKYEGHWQYGKMSGQGDYWKWLDGKYFLTYRGEWRNGKHEGQGEQFCPSGDVYSGAFVNGVRQGHGRCIYANGQVYEGEWQADARWGFGTLETPTGTYSGMWQHDKKHGNGRYVSRGNVYEGIWVNDIAKCGVYGLLDGTTADAQEGLSMPVLGLQHPVKVLQDAAASLAARAA